MTEPKHTPGVILRCGWGRLLFAQTFSGPRAVAAAILAEEPGERDIAFYLDDPHIVLSHAPQRLFLDPSHTFRLQFSDYRESNREAAGFSIGPLSKRAEVDEINRIYAACRMVPVDADYVWSQRRNNSFIYVVARHSETGKVLGVAMGVDHKAAFNDPENGSSLWALAVDPQAEFPGIGEWLVRFLVERYRGNSRCRLDLSVMHDNQGAIKLYKKLNFRKVSVFAVKCRNSINETLFVGHKPDSDYNPYASIIINEALRRGISVDPIDPERGYFKLSLGGRSITCRESLSELTSAIAMSRCDDKQLTHDLLARASIHVPAQQLAGGQKENLKFLRQHPRLVVKPVRGEQGKGITVDVTSSEELKEAIAAAQVESDSVLLEEYVEGVDLRVIVIHGEVVAAAVRRPAEVTGTGQHTIRELIESLSRRRRNATGGESRIPLDAQTRRCVRNAGFKLDSVLPREQKLRVRKTANLHTGGTIHDVTPQLHPALADAAIAAARTLEIPVTGIDFIVPMVNGPDYVIIEANERPGLANHEPQPTAEKFIDFLFPHATRSDFHA